MKVSVKNQTLFDRLAVYFATAIRILLNVLLAFVWVALVAGVLKSGRDLFLAFHESQEVILQKMLLDTVLILATVEIATTILGYLRAGRVHVRYIVDTVLIIVLNEFVSLWLKSPSLQQVIGLCVIALTLAAVRVVVVRITPSD